MNSCLAHERKLMVYYADNAIQKEKISLEKPIEFPQ